MPDVKQPKSPERTFSSYETLASGWEANHDHTDLGVIGLRRVSLWSAAIAKRRRCPIERVTSCDEINMIQNKQAALQCNVQGHRRPGQLPLTKGGVYSLTGRMAGQYITSPATLGHRATSINRQRQKNRFTYAGEIIMAIAPPNGTGRHDERAEGMSRESTPDWDRLEWDEANSRPRPPGVPDRTQAGRKDIGTDKVSSG